MADLNDLNKPAIDSNVNNEVLETLRGHITRLWKGDYTGMGNLVSGLRRWVRVGTTDVKLVQRNAGGTEDTLFDSSLLALKDGSNLTGTLAVSISGNAATATLATNATNATNAAACSGNAATATLATNATNAAAAANGVPPGFVLPFSGSFAPTGWLKANGATVSRTTYPALFGAIGTIHGAGDGATTFNLPDLRGEFIRGWDDGRGVDSGRSIGTFQNATGHTTGGRSDQPLQDYESAYSTTSHTNGPSSYQYNQGYTFGRSRPRNVALLYCIKT